MESTSVKLFNLRDDPTETTNLADDLVSQKNDMLAKLRAYQLTMLDPIDDQRDDVACNPGLHSGYWGPWMN